MAAAVDGSLSVSAPLHPHRDVSDHAPYVDVIVSLNIENEIGISPQHPTAQARKVQFVGVARGTGSSRRPSK